MDEFLKRIEGFIPETAATADPLGIIISLMLAALLGGYFAVVYHISYTGKRDNWAQFTYSLVLICLGGALVWLIVADNLVRAFGLGGALALIRYRTRMRDPKDTTLVFFAMLTGMACGLHHYFIAIYGALFVSFVLIVIRRIDERRQRKLAAAGLTEPPEDDDGQLQSPDDGYDRDFPAD